MTEESLAASRAEANRILAAAGWAPHPVWGEYARGTLVAGFQPDGQSFHVKDWAAIQPGHPHYGPDTPDEPHEAAAWLVAKFGAPVPEPLDLGAEILAAEAEAGDSLGDVLREEFTGADHGSERGGAEPGVSGDEIPGSTVAETGSRDDGDAMSGGAMGHLIGSDQGDEPLDADFSELPALEGQDVAEEPAADAGGPQFIFSDDINTIRWAKGGKLLEIAGEKEAILQAGWTLEEFAYLQNQVVRMDRGEAPDDAAARGRFAEIGAYSRAISNVTAHLKRRSSELKAADRDAVLAFDPEAGWP